MKSYTIPTDTELAKYIYDIYVQEHGLAISNNVDRARDTMFRHYLDVMRSAVLVMNTQKLLAKNAQATCRMSINYVKASYLRNNPNNLINEVNQLIKLHYLNDLL